MFAHIVRRIMKLLTPAASRRRGRKDTPTSVAFVETLESRQMLTSNTLVVTTLSDSGAGSLRDAVDQANLNTTSTTTITFSATLTGSITLASTLTVSSSTIIQINGNPITISGNNACEIFDVTSTANLAITGITLTAGSGTSGGAINNSGTVTLTNDSLTANAALVQGGAIYNSGTLNILSGVTISSNSSAAGGAIYNTHTESIKGATISNNTADSGGAIYNTGTTLATSDTFTANLANSNSGGAIDNESGATFESVANQISGNKAVLGGGVYNGGVFSSTNDTVANNMAFNGGGVYASSGTTTTTNDTITGNSATNFGGGLYLSSSADWNAINTIVAGNSPTDLDYDGTISISNLNVNDSLIANTGSLLTNGQHNNIINQPATNIFAGGLANNGGLTQTIALALGSPAIGSGSSAIDSLTITGLSLSSTSLSVGTGTFITVGDLLKIDSEIVLVTGGSGTTFSIARAQDGTIAAIHSGNAAITLADDQRGVARSLSVSDMGSYAAITPTVVANDAGGIYNGTPFPATSTVTVNGSDVSSNGTVTYTYYAGATPTGTPLPSAPTNAGTYTVVASFVSTNALYGPGTSAAVTFTIAAATPTVTVTSSSSVYTALPYQPSSTVTGVGGVTVSGATTYTYYAGSTATGTPLSSAPTNFGTYTVVASFVSTNSNYGNATSAPVTFSITAASPTFTVTSGSVVYNATAYPATSTALGIGGVPVTGTTTYTYYAGATATGTPLTSAPTNFGTYTVVANFVSSNPNYGNATSAPVTFSITAAAPVLTVTSGNSVYNAAPYPPMSTATGVGGVTVNGTTTYTYYAGSTATGTPLTSVPTNVGTYTVVASFASTDPNYGNATSAPVTFSITTSAPVATVTSGNSVYNAAPYQPTSTVIGVAGVTVTGVTTYTYYAGSTATGTPLPSAPTNFGTYTVVASFVSSDPNYGNATSAPATFRITAATPLVTVTAGNTVYNATPYQPTSVTTGLGGVTVSGTTTYTYYAGSMATGTPLVSAPTNFGTYTVVANFASSDPNYGNASSTPVTFSITAATPLVTITSGNAPFTGSPYHATSTTTGILGVPVTGTTTYTYYSGATATGTPLPSAPSNFGTYTVVASFVSSDPNYTNAMSNPLTFQIMVSGPTLVVNTLSDVSGAGVITLRDAINWANFDGITHHLTDTIVFAPTLTGTITLAQALPAIQTSMSIVQHNANPITVSGGGASSIFNIASSTATVMISGLTISQGNAGSGSGGAIFNAGILTLASDNITANTATQGAGIYNTGTLTLNNDQVTGNVANFPALNSSLAGYGGGIYNAGTMTVLNGTAITGNSAEYGGGIYNTGTEVVTNVAISGNSAEWGGGIYNDSTPSTPATTTLANDTLANDTAANVAGGAIYNGANGVMITSGDVIDGNSSVLGGGVYNSGIFNSTNDTIANNTAITGGGVYASGTLTTTNDTLTGNTVTNLGGGVYLASGGDWNSLNTIVAGNTPSDVAYDSTITSGNLNVQYTLIGDTSSGLVNGTNGNIVNPANQTIFTGGLANNGGPTLSIKLAAGSPAIASGTSLTTLAASINSAVTTFTVNSTTFLQAGDFVRIDNEIMAVVAVNSAANQITVVRGQYGSVSVAHTLNANVFLATDQRGVVRGASSDMGAVSASSSVEVLAPTSQSLLENTSAQFSNGIVNIVDVNLPSGVDSLTISVSHGTITLASVAGLTLTAGNNGTATMTFTGTLASLNAALHQFTYTPTTNYYGTDTLTIAATNSTVNVTGTATVALTVTPIAPTVTAPTTVSVNENSSATLSGANAIQFTDVNAVTDTVVLSVSHGKLNVTASGLTVTGNGTASVSISGALAAINTALKTLIYTPTTNYYGADLLHITLTNPSAGNSVTGSVNLTVIALPPTVTAPVSASVTENSTLPFTGMNAISYVDVNGTSDKLILTATHGILTLSTTGVTVVGNSTGHVTVTGSITAINAALTKLVYTPNALYYGADTLNLALTNVPDNLSLSTNVAITVVALHPAITAPVATGTSLNTSLAFTGVNAIKVTDVNGTLESMTLGVTYGTLTFGSTTGLTVAGNGTKSVMVSGTLSALNLALATLRYNPNTGYLGADKLTLSVTDTGNAFSGSTSVALTVTTPPSISASPTISLYANTSATFTGNAALSISDRTGPIDQLHLAVQHGVLKVSSVPGLSVTGLGTANLTISGLVASVNAALKTLTYTPATGYVGHDTLAMTVTNSVNMLAGSTSVAIVVNADPPPSISGPSMVSAPANGTLLFSGSNAITLSDPVGINDRLTLTVQHGTLALLKTTGLVVTGNGTKSMTILGTLAAINAALTTLTYKPTANYHGSDTLSMSLIDVTTSYSTPFSFSILVN